MAWLEKSAHSVAEMAIGTAWAGVCMVKGELPVEPGMLITVGVAGLIAVATEGLKKFGLDNRSTIDGVRKKTLKAVEAKYGTLAEQLDLKDADRALAESLKDCFLDRDALVQAALDPGGFPTRATDLVCAALAQARPEIFGADAPQAGRDFARTVVGAALDAAITTPEYFKELQPKLDLLALQSLAKLLAFNGDIAKWLADLKEDVTAVKQVVTSVKDDTSAIRAMMEQLIASGGIGRAEAAGLNETQVRNLLIAFEQQNVDIGQAEPLLLKAADELRDLRARLSHLSNQDEPEITARREAARAAIDAGDFDRADKLLSEAELADLEAGERRIMRAAQTMAERAVLARAQAKLKLCARHYGRAADIIAPYNQKAALEWWFLQAAALDDHAAIFPDLKGLREAVVILREKCIPLLLKEEEPGNWARLQNNLGIALSRLGDRAGPEEANSARNGAVAAYRAALSVYNKESSPADWAVIQNNIGNTLASLGQRIEGEKGLAHLRDAITNFREVLEVGAKGNMRMLWAAAQNNIGTALLDIGTRIDDDSGLAALNEAIAACRAALEVYSRSATPADWSSAQCNLGNCLATLGARTEGPEGVAMLKEAVAVYRAVIEFTRREIAPISWASAQGNLGMALSALGLRIGSTDGLQILGDAVTAHNAALEVRSRAEMPIDWALTTENLAGAEAAIALLSGKRLPVLTAIRRMSDVINIFEIANATYNIEKARQNLAGMRALLAVLESSPTP